MYKLMPLILRLNKYGLSYKMNQIRNQNYFLKHIRDVFAASICKYSTEILPEQECILTNEQLENITKGNAELLQKFNVLMLEVQVLRQDGDKVPDYAAVKEEQWEHLLSLSSRSARKKYLKFLWLNEKKQESEKMKKELARKAREEFFNERTEHDLSKDCDTNEYRLFGNTIFLRLYDTTVNQFFNNRLIQAMQFDRPLILDCSYSKHMNHREQLNAAKQLMLLFAANRAHDAPFDLHYCNCDFNGTVMKQLKKFITTLQEPWFPLNVHEDSYLNHFPKEKLVYLTPHCRNDLEEFNHDDIYIIGAMVDKTNSEPLSLGKAKQQGLRMARLPLDKYLAWSKSTKSLTLNQVTAIMLDLKLTGDWDKSLVHVPRRKVMSDEELSMYQGKMRHEKKSLFLKRNSEEYENTFKKRFQNLDGYENFTNDLQPQQSKFSKFGNRPEQNNFGRQNNRNDSRNKFQRPNLKQLFEDE